MRLGLAFVLLSSSFIISCAHLGPSPAGSTSQNENGNTVATPGAPSATTVDGVVGHLAEQKAVPLELNPFVDRWLDYFQGKGRQHMERYLSRSTRYVALMKEILKENGVPEEMVYVAMIESGFSFQARSRAKAVGYWQFIGGTARRYGLKMNRLVDERRDPIASTQAAAQYLKGLYNLFGQWELALAAYNVGENRVQKVIMSSYTRDYWEMARRRMLPEETLNYVPKYIAASLIAMDPAKYGFTDIEYYEPFEFEVVHFNKPVNLRTMAAHLNISYNEFKIMNPSYRSDHAPLNSDGECVIRVPKGQMQAAIEAAGKSAVSQSRFIANLDQDDRDYFYYRIKNGDSLGKIAARYGVSQGAIRHLNGLRSGKKLRAGTRIKIPGNGTVDAEVVGHGAAGQVSLSEESARPGANQGRLHIVQRGDTLAEIARTYKVKVNRLAEVNQLSKRAPLFVGAKLFIPE
jgi:membrane-bound lytic murein transglycosylase D